MSRKRLFKEMDSAEITAWQVYFEVKQEKNEDERERNRLQRDLDKV